MFHTIPEAALPIPLELAEPGMRTWRWIEFALQVPYFLVAFVVKDGEFEMEKHILSAEVGQVIEICGFGQERVQVNSVSVLLPGYVTGLKSYSLHRIAEIWESPDDPHNQLFVTSKGERFHSFGAVEGEEAVDRTCTIKLPINT